MRGFLSGLKIVILGALWTPLYVWTLVPFVWHFLDFNLLYWPDWQDRFNAFMDYRWQIKTGADVALALAMIGFVPLWICGWIACVSLFNRFVGRFKKRKERQKNLSSMRNGNKKVYAPQKMRVQSGVLLSMSAQEAQQALSAPASKAVASHPKSQMSSVEREVNSLSELASKFSAEAFRYLVFGERKLPLAISTDTCAVLVEILNEPEHWSADLSAGLAESDWYSENRHLKSPGENLKAIEKILKESEPDSVCHRVILLSKGELLNASETVEYYEKEGITLLRMEEGKPDTLETIEDFLTRVFQKEG